MLSNNSGATTDPRNVSGQTRQDDMLNISFFAATDVGKVRDNNEDFFLVEPSLNLYLVCDGMGGHAAGEIAARCAGESVANYLSNYRSELQEASTIGDCSRLEHLLIKAVKFACIEVNQLARTAPFLAGMGTTLTLVMIHDDVAIMAHVGDSQLYHWHDERVTLRSHDHTLAAELKASGALANASILRRFQNVLTRSIGPAADVEVETCVFGLSGGDRLLLCTDGLTKYPGSLLEIQGILRRDASPQSVKLLVECANERGGSDNVTVVLVQMDEPKIQLQH